MAATVNFDIDQGSTFRKNITWQTGEPAVPVVITGWHARLQFRTNLDDIVPVISITDVANSQGQIILDGPNGGISIYINDTTTNSLIEGGVYDLELIASNNDVTRLTQGKYKVNLNVTR